MFIELLGHPLDSDEFENIIDLNIPLNNSNIIFEPILIHSDNVSFIQPAGSENALIYTIDGAVIISQDPYNFVKSLFLDDRMTIRLGEN